MRKDCNRNQKHVPVKTAGEKTFSFLRPKSRKARAGLHDPVSVFLHFVHIDKVCNSKRNRRADPCNWICETYTSRSERAGEDKRGKRAHGKLGKARCKRHAALSDALQNIAVDKKLTQRKKEHGHNV